MTSTRSTTSNGRRTAATVRVGIIGVGMIGEDHARRLTHTLAGAQVTGVTDVDATRATAVAHGLPAARVYASASELIAADDVDALLVTSWGPAHEEHVLAAISAGKPVFCEKPLAPTADACLRIIDAEREHGRRLVQVGFMRRYDSGYRAMKAALDNNQIGAALIVHNKHRNPSVPNNYIGDMPITDTAIHELELMRWLLSEEIVAARVLTPRRTSRAGQNLQDPLIILLESASGVHIDIEVFVNCVYGYDVACELVGETGAIRLTEPADVEVRSAGSRAERIAADWRERFVRAYDTELAAWLASVSDGTASGPSAWDGYAAAMVSDACIRSLHSGDRTVVTLSYKPPFYAS